MYISKNMSPCKYYRYYFQRINYNNLNILNDMDSLSINCNTYEFFTAALVVLGMQNLSSKLSVSRRTLRSETIFAN